MGYVIIDGQTVHTSCLSTATEFVDGTECYASDGVNYYKFENGQWICVAAGDIMDGQHGSYHMDSKAKEPKPGRRGYIPCPPVRKAKKGS